MAAKSSNSAACPDTGRTNAHELKLADQEKRIQALELKEAELRGIQRALGALLAIATLALAFMRFLR